MVMDTSKLLIKKIFFNKFLTLIIIIIIIIIIHSNFLRELHIDIDMNMRDSSLAL